MVLKVVDESLGCLLLANKLGSLKGVTDTRILPALIRVLYACCPCFSVVDTDTPDLIRQRSGLLAT